MISSDEFFPTLPPPHKCLCHKANQMSNEPWQLARTSNKLDQNEFVELKAAENGHFSAQLGQMAQLSLRGRGSHTPALPCKRPASMWQAVARGLVNPLRYRWRIQACWG